MIDRDEQLRDVRARQERVRPADTPRAVRYPLGERTVPAYVDEHARRTPDRIALVGGATQLSYADLADRHARWAGWLRAHGVAAGERVAVHLGNLPEFVIAFLGTLRAGAVHVPLNPMFQHAELTHELSDSGARTVVTSAALVDRLAPVAASCGVSRIVVVGADGDLPTLPGVEVTGWDDALTAAPLREAATDLDALAALNYTGGTTGLPKGCEHTQRHMLYTAAGMAGACGLEADGTLVSLCFIPVFWIAGEDLGILVPLVLGGRSVLMPRWDPAAAVELIERHRVTTLAATVENYLQILVLPDVAGRDLTSLTAPLAMSFIRKLTPQIRRRWAATIGPDSVLREGAYGMTETHTCDVVPHGFDADDHDLRTQPVFCGLPVPGTDVLIVDPVDGALLPLGERGEIVLRSPSVMRGYWRNPEATREQVRDGWLHTGDSGYLDEDGCLHYLARSKEMMKVTGMSVFPAEIEMLLAQHPAVRSTAVVPVPDERTGQRPVAFVTLEDGARIDAADLQDWARDRMASYKLPLIEVLAAFPLTDTGKIRKVELADRATALHRRRRG